MGIWGAKQSRALTALFVGASVMTLVSCSEDNDRGRQPAPIVQPQGPAYPQGVNNNYAPSPNYCFTSIDSRYPREFTPYYPTEWRRPRHDRDGRRDGRWDRDNGINIGIGFHLEGARTDGHDHDHDDDNGWDRDDRRNAGRDDRDGRDDDDGFSDDEIFNNDGNSNNANFPNPGPGDNRNDIRRPDRGGNGNVADVPRPNPGDRDGGWYPRPGRGGPRTRLPVDMRGLCACPSGTIPACSPRGLMCVPLDPIFGRRYRVAMWGWEGNGLPSAFRPIEVDMNSFRRRRDNSCYRHVAQTCRVNANDCGFGRCMPLYPGRNVGVCAH